MNRKPVVKKQEKWKESMEPFSMKNKGNFHLCNSAVKTYSRERVYRVGSTIGSVLHD